MILLRLRELDMWSCGSIENRFFSQINAGEAILQSARMSYL